MESGFVALLVLALVAAIIVGMIIKNACKSTQTHGIIHVAYSDPDDGPYLFLELKVPVNEIVSRKRVMLDVDATQFYSHE